MSEMEDLKNGVAESKARQQVDALNTYMGILIEEKNRSLLRSLRADALFMFSICGWFAITLTTQWMHSSEAMTSFATQAAYLVEMLSIAHSWFWTRSWGNAEAELKGCIKTLVILGMLPPREANRTRQKRPVFERGVELVKKWTAQKKKAQEGLFAPA